MSDNLDEEDGDTLFALDLHPQPSVNCNTIRSTNFALYFVVVPHLHVFSATTFLCDCTAQGSTVRPTQLRRQRMFSGKKIENERQFILSYSLYYGTVFRGKLYCAFLARLQHSKICVRLVLCSVEKCCGASHCTRPPATTSATFPSAPSFIRSKFSRHCKVEAILYPEKYMHMIFQRRF